jgi:phage FluMu gp28-like protein
MILGERIRDLLARIPREVRRSLLAQGLKTIFRFRNGSRILVLPNSENQLRGFTAHLIVVDEAAFFPNDEEIFRNILPPMLATTDGRLVVSSTPWGRNSVFYQLDQDPSFSKHVVTWRDAAGEGRYSQSFLERIEEEGHSRPHIYRMEYLAEFVEEVDTWLSQDLLAGACRGDLEYLGFDSPGKGVFYMGIDLAERVDYSVIAVVERKKDKLDLVHIHRFPRGTALASVIGYARVLGGRWRSIKASYVDNTKHGDYIIVDMVEAQVPNPRGVIFTLDRKMEMAQILRQRMEEGRLGFPYDRSLMDELNNEKYELTKAGKITFSHPPGTHDDRFWALALAVYAAEGEAMGPPIARSI